jgi:hypothetical protein
MTYHSNHSNVRLGINLLQQGLVNNVFNTINKIGIAIIPTIIPTGGKLVSLPICKGCVNMNLLQYTTE